MLPAGLLDEHAVTLACERVAQRNWSRVGRAVDGERRAFVKQFVDANGNWHAKQFRYETEGARIAFDALSDVVYVPRLVHADEENLLHIYEFCDVVATDTLLRREPERFQAQFPHLLRAMRQVLAILAGSDLPPGCTDLPVKQRPYGGPSNALNFKGLDIRNAGIGTDPDRPVVMFDFGRPYRAPMEEAGAKILVSVGLLNWGQPMLRFLKGPDTALLETVIEPLTDYLSLDAVLAECEQQRRVRTTEVKATNVVQRALKSAGVKTVGKSYFRTLARWCGEHVR